MRWRDDAAIARFLCDCAEDLGVEEVRAQVAAWLERTAPRVPTGPELRARRRGAGVSQSDVAREVLALGGRWSAGTLLVSLSRWEAGAAPGPELRAAIEQALASLEDAARQAGAGPTLADGAALIERLRGMRRGAAGRVTADAAQAVGIMPRSAANALYSWAAGRSTPPRALREALIAAVEREDVTEAEARDVERAVEEATRARGEAPPAIAPVSEVAPVGQRGLTFADLLSHKSEDVGG